MDIFAAIEPYVDVCTRGGDENRKLALWGMGRVGESLGSELNTLGLPFDTFDSKKQGCQPPDVLQGQREKYFVIVTMMNGYEAVGARLSEFGFCEGRDYLCLAKFTEVWKTFAFPGEPKITWLRRDIDLLRMALGRIESRQINGFHDTEFQVFSQNGEDGIIQYLVQNLPIKVKKFVEFGVENYREANTRFLLEHDNWSGLVMDGSEQHIRSIKEEEIYWRFDLRAQQAFITRENINELLRQGGMSGHIGLLSIDIDGNDYWVWEAITEVDADIVIVEYNPRFGAERAVTIPYDAEWTRFKVHYSGIYFGASIKALEKLGMRKGYALVAVNQTGANLFFVKRELLNDKVKAVSAESAYVPNSYHDSRDESGHLDFKRGKDELALLNGLPLVDV